MKGDERKEATKTQTPPPLRIQEVREERKRKESGLKTGQVKNRRRKLGRRLRCKMMRQLAGIKKEGKRVKRTEKEQKKK